MTRFTEHKAMQCHLNQEFFLEKFLIIILCIEELFCIHLFCWIRQKLVMFSDYLFCRQSILNLKYLSNTKASVIVFIYNIFNYNFMCILRSDLEIIFSLTILVNSYLKKKKKLQNHLNLNLNLTFVKRLYEFYHMQNYKN